MDHALAAREHNSGEVSFTNSLPAKGIARTLGAVAMAGCALSLLVNLLVLFGVFSRGLFNFTIDLFLGVFPIGLVAVLAVELLVSELSFYDRTFRIFNREFGRKVRWTVILGKSPKWLRTVWIALMIYALAQFTVFTYETFPRASSNQLDEVRLFSCFAAAFYSAYAAVFASYANTERPVRRDEL